MFDQVLLHYNDPPPGVDKKLFKCFQGPFFIDAVFDSDCYVVRKPSGRALKCTCQESRFSTRSTIQRTLTSCCRGKPTKMSQPLTYSLRPKLSTESSFMEQKCHFRVGFTQHKNAATPLSTLDINTTRQYFQMKYMNLFWLKEIKSYQPK